ncbi:hypothetical protein [Halorubrum sp. AJ67]|uniref:hypothetical protein n=1 Tax=Halorubrum sp. AJ67 TaxID=1173487 RepID=UPI00064FFD57|nr:hypothetical protein [Halorubrum sp. AJ67]
MTSAEAVVVLGIIDGAIGTITQSWYLTAIAVVAILTVGLSILSGLIDIAVYLTMLGLVALVGLGVVNFFAPNLIPIVATPALLFEPSTVEPMIRLTESAATPLIPSV